MKKLLSFLFFLSLNALACAGPVATPEQPSAVENTALPTQAVQLTPTPSTSTPIPTLTETLQAVVQPTLEFPTFTPPTVTPNNQVTVVRFSANGTYTDVADTIALGSSKTYSLSAAKGQIMSISILPQIPSGDWGYIPMQIKGADGKVLCPQTVNSECSFWRGILPASQDYFITLTPNINVSKFVMRVAINPPGKDIQYFQYADPATGLSLVYPDTFAPALPVIGNYKVNPEFTLHFIDSKFYENTNLSEVYMFVSYTSDAQAVSTCTDLKTDGSPEYIVGNEVIEGFTFVHSKADGAGAGNFYEQEIYRMANKGICYEVIDYIHSTNIENYTSGTVTEFDKTSIIQKLNGVFATFTIK